MQRRLARLLVPALALLMLACAGYRHLEAGDAAAAAGDSRGALYYYQQALGQQQSLARDRGFMKKLSAAEARVAYDEAVRMRGRGEYEPAIEHLRAAIDRDGSYEAPMQLLPHVRAEAARWRYGLAVEAADRGRLDTARGHLDLALQNDLSNEEAALARAAMTPDQLPAATPGLAAYREGVSRSAERRWAQAEQALAQAVAEGPSLLPARAALYEARATLAEARRLTNDGASHVAERRMGPAIEALTRSIEAWPFNERAEQLLEQAAQQRALADEHLASASKAANNSDWDEAFALTDGGLAIDRSHPALLELRRQLQRRAAADFADQGGLHLAAGRLAEAQSAYAQASELDPALQAARAGLHSAETGLDQARGLMSRGASHLAERRLAPAMQSLSKSLEVWPFNEQAAALLTEAKQQREEADARHAAAAQAAKDGDWDAAIALSNEGLALDSSHAAMNELRRALPARAAAHYTAEGENQLAAGQLDNAHAAYARAMTYVVAHNDALSGMAAVYLARGEGLEAAGRPGAALLHYAKGQTFRSTAAIEAARARAMQAVYDRVGMGLGVSVAQNPDGGVVAAREVGDAIADRLGGYNERGLVVGGEAVPYVLQVNITGSWIDQRLTGTDELTHPYTTRELRHNAEYDRLLDRLRHEQEACNQCLINYQRAVRDRDTARRRADRARGSSAGQPGEQKASQSQPRQKQQAQQQQQQQQQQRQRQQQEQQRQQQREQEHRAAQERQRQQQEQAQRQQQEQQRQQQQRQQQEQDRQRRQNPQPPPQPQKPDARPQQPPRNLAYERELARYREYAVRCDALLIRFNRQDRLVKSLKRQLANTPHQVRVTVHHAWPYTVETYTLRGELTVASELIDTESGEVIERFDHGAELSVRDDRVINANPGIGLADDRLSLPSDGFVTHALSTDLAQAAAPRALDLAVQHRLGLVTGARDAAQQAGDDDAALEAEVDMAVLLGIVDPAASANLLDALIEQHTP